MLINALIVLIGLICLAPRAHTAIKIFVVPAVMFQIAIMLGAIPDIIFYLIAAALDLFVIRLLIRRASMGFVAVFVGTISLLSIFVNMFGWSAYERGLDPSMYNDLFASLYALVLALTLTDWWTYARADSYGGRFRGYSH